MEEEEGGVGRIHGRGLSYLAPAAAELPEFFYDPVLTAVDVLAEGAAGGEGESGTTGSGGCVGAGRGGERRGRVDGHGGGVQVYGRVDGRTGRFGAEGGEGGAQASSAASVCVGSRSSSCRVVGGGNGGSAARVEPRKRAQVAVRGGGAGAAGPWEGGAGRAEAV